MVGQFNSSIQSSEDLLQQYDNGFHLQLEAQRAALRCMDSKRLTLVLE